MARGLCRESDRVVRELPVLLVSQDGEHEAAEHTLQRREPPAKVFNVGRARCADELVLGESHRFVGDGDGFR